MHSSAGLTTAQVLATFTDEVAARGGEVTDAFDDGRRLLARSVLPHVEDVRPGDRLRGGVAVRATEREVWMHPYLFRLVCRNGAIVARTLQTRHLADLDARDAGEAAESVRGAVGACCQREVFADTVVQVMTAVEAEADLAVALMPLLSRLTASGNAHLLSEIMDRFFAEGDRSLFGLANAVTATARDARDPALRWDLEEFGGGLAVGVPPSPGGGLPVAARRGQVVSVG